MEYSLVRGNLRYRQQYSSIWLPQGTNACSWIRDIINGIWYPGIHASTGVSISERVSSRDNNDWVQSHERRQIGSDRRTCFHDPMVICRRIASSNDHILLLSMTRLWKCSSAQVVRLYERASAGVFYVDSPPPAFMVLDICRWFLSQFSLIVLIDSLHTPSVCSPRPKESIRIWKVWYSPGRWTGYVMWQTCSLFDTFILTWKIHSRGCIVT